MNMVSREWIHRLQLQSETLANAKHTELVSYELKQRDALYRKFNLLPKIIKTNVSGRLPELKLFNPIKPRSSLAQTIYAAKKQVRNECAICFNKRILVKISCGNQHSLCRICISKLTKCPFCREEF